MVEKFVVLVQQCCPVGHVTPTKGPQAPPDPEELDPEELEEPEEPEDPDPDVDDPLPPLLPDDIVGLLDELELHAAANAMP